MGNKINIVSTKKLSDEQKKSLINFNVIDEDFISINYRKVLSKGEDLGEALIFSSQNAVQAVLQSDVLEHLKAKNVFCVGNKTKDLLTENGFNVVAYTGYAADLVEIISLIYNKESYTFFCGNLRRDILPNKLKENGITFNEVTVYETKLTPQKINKKIDGILFFSPSGVTSFLEKNKITNEICFCIGETTAEALENHKINNIIIAENPSVENVITEVVEYYKN